MKVYKPWLLLNPGNYSSKLLASLDKCAEAWTLYGLEEAVKTISESHNVEHAHLAKTLLASVKTIHELDLSRRSFSEGKKICGISLLSTEELQGALQMILNSLCGLSILRSFDLSSFSMQQT